jgi:DNA mismatch repair protein MutH
VQFAEGSVPGEKCPARSIYGKARAFTPLLDQPISGPVFLRSSSHELPDLVASLHGQVDVVVVGRVDSVKGRLRNTFEAVPDAPVSKFVLQMQGGRRGLVVNSVDLCKREQRATLKMRGQNGKEFEARPLVRNSCKGKRRKHKR